MLLPELGQYRIMEQVLSPKDFVPRESVEKAGILDVFPFFHTAQLGQKIRRKPQSPPSGVALDNHLYCHMEKFRNWVDAVLTERMLLHFLQFCKSLCAE